ncbi:MAG: hypothetical protein Q8Q30_00135 [Candidatus Woesebacteria bacterium]|nr:hypothetical protein [Candidatus Woesebacteria bacterium]
MTERRIRICFGTVFKVTGYEDRVDVITDVGSGGVFEAACLHENEQGEKWFLSGGTGDKEKIEKVIGRLTLQEVTAALELGAKQIDLQELPEGAREVLENLSKAKPRILK